jgi:hypothetical protein
VEGIIEAGLGEGEGMQYPMGDGQRIGIVPAGLFLSSFDGQIWSTRWHWGLIAVGAVCV